VAREYPQRFHDPKLPLQKRRAVIGGIAPWVLALAPCRLFLIVGGPVRQESESRPLLLGLVERGIRRMLGLGLGGLGAAAWDVRWGW
jgi:hypothetical protein